MPDRFALVLAGGRGERFWPWSRPERPKQLLPLAPGGRTLLRATVDRIGPLLPPERCLVLTSRDLVAAVARECPPGTHVIGEPAGRNTAPAIGAAAHWVAARSKDASFVVLPADHVIEDEDAFRADLDKAFRAAESSAVLVVFGIPPTHGHAGLGYVRRGTALAERLVRVAAFTEKPSREKAQEFVASGEYLWNAGIFVWKAGVFLDALRAGRPAVAEALRPLAEAKDGFEAVLERVLPACESISVDYAVLEKAPNVLMVEAAFDWDDVGSWGAWAKHQPRDANGNVLVGDAIAVDCERCIVVGEGGTAAALGLTDTVVVHANGVTMSCPVERDNEVRRLAETARTGER